MEHYNIIVLSSLLAYLENATSKYWLMYIVDRSICVFIVSVTVAPTALHCLRLRRASVLETRVVLILHIHYVVTYYIG